MMCEETQNERNTSFRTEAECQNVQECNMRGGGSGGSERVAAIME